MIRRQYRLGRRQASVDRTAAAIVAAARQVLIESSPSGLSVGVVARRAGVSRLTIYNRFGSRAGLIEAAVPHPMLTEPDSEDPREALRLLLQRACSAWAADPALFRHLPDSEQGDPDAARRLAERLASADALRAGCSLREAQDVIGALTSFALFDRLHQGGRRSAAAVAEILMRLGAGILA